jgi:hypothetical protein
MADSRRQYILIAFKVIGVLGEPAKDPRNVGGDGRLLRND